jgi:YbgC/YbaW family acyl-CoA thioester hydrolase
MHEFTTRRRIEFADTDMGGIVHFSRYFVFMETAEHLFLNELGTSVAAEHEGQPLGWPRVAASCEYAHPARFGDELEIGVRVRRRGVKSMTYDFSFRCAGREIARGTLTAVCCRLGPAGRLEAIPIPDAIARRIGPAPAP